MAGFEDLPDELLVRSTVLPFKYIAQRQQRCGEVGLQQGQL